MSFGSIPTHDRQPSPTTALETLKKWLQNPNNSESFRSFYDLYEPVIRRWADRFLRKKNAVLHADMEDLVHDAVLFLWETCFVQRKYDPGKRMNKGGFRKWMHTSASRAWEESVRRWGKDRGRGGEGWLVALESREAAKECADSVDLEVRRTIVAEVLAELEPELDEPDRLILNVLGLGHGNTNPVDGSGRTRADEIARELGINVPALYTRKSKLRETVRLRAEQKLAQLSFTTEAEHARSTTPTPAG